MTAPKADRSDYLGCGLWAGGFLVLVVVSFAVGVVLRPDNDQSDLGVRADGITLARVGADGDGYRLIGGRDEVDDPCVVLYERRAEVTGQCGYSFGTANREEEGRYGITSAELADGTTVVFAPVPPGTASVAFALTDGTEVEAVVQYEESADVSYFVHEGDAGVDGSATFLGADGDPIPEPG